MDNEDYKKVYCHTTYKYDYNNDYQNCFEEGKWYYIYFETTEKPKSVSPRSWPKSDFCSIRGDSKIFGGLINFYKNRLEIVNGLGPAFSDYFYTEQEYRTTNLNELLDE